MLRVPKSQHRKLRVMAAKDNLSMAAWAEKILLPEIEKRAGAKQ
jgi:predicted HicB family RNase H-like nuclease